MDDLLHDFLHDTRQHVARAGARLARLEEDPSDRAMIGAVVRLLQAIRGTSEVLKYGRVRRLTEAAEGVMARLRAGAPATSEAVTLVLAALERIETILTDVERRRAAPDDTDDALVAALRAWRDAPTRPEASTRRDGRSLDPAPPRRGAPFARVLEGLRAGANLGEGVALVAGGDTAHVDFHRAEALRDPLTRLVRFCADTIETPETRAAAGKGARGMIRVTSLADADGARIEIVGDGGELDLTRIGVAAMRRGFLDDDALAAMGSDDLAALILAPGVASAIAPPGRAHGDLGGVWAAIAALGGTIAVKARSGEAPEFVITIPSPRARLPALIAISGGTRVALARANVVAVVAVGEGGAEVAHLGHTRVLIGESLLPAMDLAEVLPRSDDAPGEDASHEAGTSMAIVVRAADRTFAVLVDDVDDFDDIPAPVDDATHAHPVIAGLSLLADGSTITVLDPAALAATFAAAPTSPAARATTSATRPDPRGTARIAPLARAAPIRYPGGQA